MIGCVGDITTCTCPNCTEREAKVQAEANARRKALLALDQAMTDLASANLDCWYLSKTGPEYIVGLATNCNDAWQAARRFIL